MSLSKQQDPKTVALLNANWIWIPDWIDSSRRNTAGRLVSFTRQFRLDDVPNQALLHFSADTRYKLSINGKHVIVGPSRGSSFLWFYDSVDVASLLRRGDNEIEFLVVRYFAANRAAMPFGRTSFPGLTVVGTVEQQGRPIALETSNVQFWHAKVFENIDFPTGVIDDGFLHIYERVEPQHNVLRLTPKCYGFKTLNGDLLPWRLRPRMIPTPEQTPAFIQAVRARQSTINSDEWNRWLAGSGPIVLPAYSSHTLDLQAEVHSTAFVKWTFRASSRTQLRLKITYSEGYEHEPRSYPYFRTKDDRLDFVNGHIVGPYDDVVVSVPEDQPAVYEPFWFRTFRVMRTQITLGSSPVEFAPVQLLQVNYPLETKAIWQEPSEPQHMEMWDVSIRTLRNCMFDGYSDCPFYEQLQYSMDSRAVGLFHYMISGDDRLMRQAITIFASSTTLEGLPQSRFPSHVNQLIAAFPLYWILEVCDHHLYFGDDEFTRSCLPRVDGIFEFFDQHITEQGLVGGLPNDLWQFVDWVTTWHATDDHPDKGVPTSGRRNNLHTYFSMLLAYVLREAAVTARQVGRAGLAEEYDTRAGSLCIAVRTYCYDGRYFTDSTAAVADELSYSQHCQIWGILCGAVPVDDRRRLIRECFAGDSKIAFSRCSYMMRFYAFRAFALAGDDVYEWFWAQAWDPWKNMLSQNLTTWEEDDVRQRSDCHAWGSVPISEFCTEVAGIQVTAPGASRIHFRPRLRLSKGIKATIAVGKDNIAEVSWALKADGGKIIVELRLRQAVHVVSRLPGAAELDHGRVDRLTLEWSE